MVWEGRRNAVTLRAQLRESLEEAARLRVSSKGPCVRERCRAKSTQLSELRGMRSSGAATKTPQRREEAKVSLLNSQLQGQVDALKRELEVVNRRRRCDRGAAEARDELSAEVEARGLEVKELRQSVEKAEVESKKKIRGLEAEKAKLAARCEHAKSSLQVSAARRAMLEKHLGAEKLERAAAEAERELEMETQMAERKRDSKEMLRLQGRSAELTSLRHAAARTGVKRGSYSKWEASEVDGEELITTKPSALSPASKLRRKQLLQNNSRVVGSQIMLLYDAIGEDCDAEVLADALEATDMIDKLLDTAPFWQRRIEQAQALMSEINEAWGAALSARMKSDYLLSNRDLDAMRIDFSFVLVNNIPRHRPLLINPHASGDTKQRVLYPEPITKRTGGWAEVIKSQAEHFGLIYNEHHEDATERDWDRSVQALVERDADLFHSPETFGPDRPLQLVLGFDGAADFCHVCVRAVDYKADVAKESEMKGVGLSVAIGNDHNQNLQLQFKTLGVKINRAIEEGGWVLLQGRSVPYKVRTCLDYSASRSVNGMRSNSAPHSLKLHPHLEIIAPAAAPWKKVKKLLEKKLPWREFNPDVPLNHLSNGVFPFGCSRCPYTAADEEEEAENVANHLAMTAMKGAAATKATAARVKAHCEAHDDVMEFETRIVRIHPRDNIVDLLHAMDINLAMLLLKFSIHDPVLFAENPELPHMLTRYYTFIGCPFDLLGDKSWFHGSVWHYDFVMGANNKSPGFDMNILICCLICFGVKGGDVAHAGDDAGPSALLPDQVIDDMDDDTDDDSPNANAEGEDGELDKILRGLFGHNGAKVRSIFEAACAYAETFESLNDEWTTTDQDYKDARALRTYRGGLRLLLGMKSMSNSRCQSHYLPLVAYVLPQQISVVGDPWPFSTRAVEGRGGRLKRISRKCNHRKRAKEVWKSVKNLKLATVNFKKSAYNSSRTLQMFRTQAAQEESAHLLHGRSRLLTTGRNTLKRNLPKWNAAERPELGKLLNTSALSAMILRAAAVFASQSSFETEAELEMAAQEGAEAH